MAKVKGATEDYDPEYEENENHGPREGSAHEGNEEDGERRGHMWKSWRGSFKSRPDLQLGNDGRDVPHRE